MSITAERKAELIKALRDRAAQARCIHESRCQTRLAVGLRANRLAVPWLRHTL